MGEVADGQSVRVRITGLAPSKAYRIVLHSSPVLLATLTSSAAGVIDATVQIPAGTPVGQHTLRISAADAPDVVVASVPLRVTDARLAAMGGGDASGALVLGILLLLAGTALIVARRRRQA